MTSDATIAEIAAKQRRDNACVITLVLTMLGLAVLGPAWFLGAKTSMLAVVVGTNIAYGTSYFLVRRWSVTPGMVISVVSMLAQHLALAAGNHELEPTPYLACIPILIATATLPSRWMWVVFGLTSATLGLESVVRTMTRMDQVALLAGFVLMIVTFVVSLLHVHSTEKAFAVATERDRLRASAAAAARESEERFRLIADHSDDLFALLDSSTCAVYLSPSHARWFGQSMRELASSPFSRLVVPDCQESFSLALTTALTDGESRFEASLRGSNDRVRIFDLRLTRVESKQGPLVAMTGRDISERKQLEQRLLASERMESLGRLAGSVAHDFNNLLMVISGAAEMAHTAVKDRKQAAEDIESLLEATRSATKLTRQLLTFSRKQVVAVAELDLAEALGKIRELIERLVGKKVTVVFDFEPECPKVTMALAHLEQLVMNLSINARDAMPNGGQLSIAVKRCLLDADPLAPLPAGHYVEILVTDQGVGIPEEVRSQIFEPLFTTKGEAGTGLGLATCQSIVSQCHGSISVESELGRGSVFRVLLPASTQAVAHASTRPSPIPQSVRRVLVVDDEPGPRETAARLLRASGFEVIVASNLQEARQCIEDPSLPLDALLTDVVLSGELGTDLLTECRSLRPQARIVVMSGYVPNPSANEKLRAVSAKFLPKPFDRQELLRALRGEAAN